MNHKGEWQFKYPNMPPITDATPFYKRITIYLFGLSLAGAILFLGQDIIVPLAFSILLAILLLPAINWLEKKKVPRVTAILIALVIAIIFLAALIYFISSQVMSFADDLPSIKKHLEDHYLSLQKWVRKTFNLTIREQKALISNATAKMKDSTPGVIGETFLSVTQTLLLVFLLPIYSFLLLYYRGMIRRFLLKIFADEHEEKIEEVLKESRLVIQNYMVGLMIEMAIVAVLNVAGFMILGIQYAILLGLVAAILNMIPYIGMLIATVLCILVTASSSENLSDILWVWAILSFVQFIDNNILMPKIVGSKVKINALITILAVLVGGALCGISGMFLAIPGIAILKVVFDRVEGLQAWGMLLGDDITGKQGNRFISRINAGMKRKPKPVAKQTA